MFSLTMYICLDFHEKDVDDLNVDDLDVDDLKSKISINFCQWLHYDNLCKLKISIKNLIA